MKWGGIRNGVRRLFRLDVRTPGRIRAEANEELYSLIDARIEHLVARGMAPEEARAETERRLGGTLDEVRVVLEQSALRREERMRLSERFDWIRQDIGVTLRGLAAAPAFTATVVLTLALGVGANSAVFSVLNGIFLQEPRGISNAREIRRVYQRGAGYDAVTRSSTVVNFPSYSYAPYSLMRSAMNGRGDLAAFTVSDSTALGHGDAEVPVRRAYVTDNYFSTLGVRVARGRFFFGTEGRVESDPGVAVISYALWDRAFGRDPGVIGRSIELHRRSYVVIGVAGRDFAGIDLNKTELFLPLGAFDAPPDRGRPWYQSEIATYFRLVARIPAGDDREFRARGTVIVRRYAADARRASGPGTSGDTISAVLTGPVIEALGPETRPKEYAIGLRIAGVTAIVLLIACANVANLLLVRGIQRRREVAVRLALGVSRRRLLAQMLIEGIVLSILGAGAAGAVAAWGSAALRRTILPSTHWATPALDLRVLAFALATALLTGLVASLLPAVQASRVDIVHSLKMGGHGGDAGRSRVRGTLLAAQTALALVLIVGAGLFVRSVQKLQRIPIGYAVDELSFVSLAFDGSENHDLERRSSLPQAAAAIANAPGVKGVALANHAPMAGASYAGLFLPGTGRARISASYARVSPGYFSVTGMMMSAGRGFTPDDRAGPGGTVIVNSTMASLLWHGQSPLGQCLIIGTADVACSTVVGVTSDARLMTVLETTPTAQYYLPLRAAADSEAATPTVIIVRAAPGATAGAEGVARATLKRLVPFASAVRFRTMRSNLEPQFRPWRLGATLFTAFGLLALLVAAVGVYGVIAYAFSQRTHELGIRTALGASVRDTYDLVLGEALRLTAIGVAAGVLLALALGRLIASQLYATSAKDPLVIASAALVLLAVGVTASLVPAWRATKTDPMSALRAE